MLLSLWLPIVLSGVALFFASFLSWMVLQLHKQDWLKMPDEDAFIQAVRDGRLVRGQSYMFPTAGSPEEMKSPALQEKMKTGPCGVITVFDGHNMGRNLGLTLVAFLVSSFCLAYLGTIALKPGEDFLTVFRFFATAGLLTFLTAIVQHSIWFQNRIVGHVIESIGYALIVGLIFAQFWPQA
ncbi:MAG: hypothetical protein JNM18_24760 [Planctomycetaceae bacterium]|nr:hypothetical protein [Planctomycetaceae bacterium]